MQGSVRAAAFLILIAVAVLLCPHLIGHASVLGNGVLDVAALPKATPTAIVRPTDLPNLLTHNADWTPVVESFEDVAMVLVPPGCFDMGSSPAEIDAAFQQCDADYGIGTCSRDWFSGEGPVHRVCFEQSFWIDRYEVDNAQFAHFAGVAEKESAVSGPHFPREQITWTEARDFCALRGARLPSEAEWEYAARGPDSLRYPWGNSFLDKGAAYRANVYATAPVDSYPAGVSWVGALNMSGNVWEWVHDWYADAYYVDSPVDNPAGPESGEYRVNRGGGWYNFRCVLRAATRAGNLPSHWDWSLGFRCARSS